MAGIVLKPGLRYQLNQKVYQIKKMMLDGPIQVVEVKTELYSVTTEKEIRDALFAGDLKFEIPGVNTIPGKFNINTNYKWSDFDQVDKKYRSRVIQRYLIVREFLRLPPDCRTEKDYEQALIRGLETIYNEIQTILKPPSMRTAQRWLKRFKGSNGDIRSLAPSYDECGGPGQARLPEEYEEIIEQAITDIFLQGNRPLPQAVHNEMLNRISDLKDNLRVGNGVANSNDIEGSGKKKTLAPCIRTICNRIGDVDPRRILKDRYGEQALDARYGVVGKTTPPEAIFEMMEMDNTPCNIIVVDDDDYRPIGRVNLTFGIDGYSGYPGGYYAGFEPFSGYTAMECLYHVIHPKDYVQELYPNVNHSWDYWSQPHAIRVDRGMDYQGADFAHACLQLNIQLEDCKGRNPKSKPSIERFFRTHSTMLNQLPGTTFSSIFQKGEYDSEKHAVITLSDLHHITHIWLLDIYAQRWHKGKQCIPAKRWSEGLEKARLVYPPNRDELKILLSSCEKRTIQRVGIECFGLIYFCPQLVDIGAAVDRKGISREVVIKYRKDDISRLYLIEPIHNQIIEVPAKDQDYTKKLSLYKHNIVVEYLRSQKKEVNIYELAKADRRIREIVEDAYTRARKSSSRKRQARFLGKGAAPWVEDLKSPDTFPVPISSEASSDLYSGIAQPIVAENQEPEATMSELEVNAANSEQAITITGARKKAPEAKEAGAGKRGRKKTKANEDAPKAEPINIDTETIDLSGFYAEID